MDDFQGTMSTRSAELESLITSLTNRVEGVAATLERVQKAVETNRIELAKTVRRLETDLVVVLNKKAYKVRVTEATLPPASLRLRVVVLTSHVLRSGADGCDTGPEVEGRPQRSAGRGQYHSNSQPGQGR